jgi:transcription initiation factor TFIIIB Brf1 subunit/transcription initiation factor TFIIB
MTERHTTKQTAGEKKAAKNANRRKPLTPATRPSQSRNTDSVSGACRICGDHEWDTDITRGETSCATCGYVAAQNMIDPGAEWVNYSNGDDRSRVGAPTTLTLSDKGLSTEISRGDLSAGAAKRHGMNSRAARDWRRRQRIDQRSKTRDSRARNLMQAMQFIRDRGALPPQIQQQAASLYRHSVERGLVTGRSIRGVSAACVYIAAREAKIPRRIEEIAEAFDMRSEVEKKELKRTIRLVARHLGTHHITGLQYWAEPETCGGRSVRTFRGKARNPQESQESSSTAHPRKALRRAHKAKSARSQESAKSHSADYSRSSTSSNPRPSEFQSDGRADARIQIGPAKRTEHGC